MDYSRQADLVDSRIFDTPVTVIGAGGIGSFVTLALAKMGFKEIYVFDDDKVEEHNLPNQFYPLDSIGRYKVDELQVIVQRFTGTEIRMCANRWDKTMLLQGVVISAVDTMNVRKELYEALNSTKCIFIDGRMGGQQAEVRTCDMSKLYDKKFYKKTLWKDSETSVLPCTQKAVMYNVLFIASLIANQCRLALEHKQYQREIIYDFENSVQLVR